MRDRLDQTTIGTQVLNDGDTDAYVEPIIHFFPRYEQKHHFKN